MLSIKKTAIFSLFLGMLAIRDGWSWADYAYNQCAKNASYNGKYVRFSCIRGNTVVGRPDDYGKCANGSNLAECWLSADAICAARKDVVMDNNTFFYVADGKNMNWNDPSRTPLYSPLLKVTSDARPDAKWAQERWHMVSGIPICEYNAAGIRVPRGSPYTPSAPGPNPQSPPSQQQPQPQTSGLGKVTFFAGESTFNKATMAYKENCEVKDDLSGATCNCVKGRGFDDRVYANIPGPGLVIPAGKKLVGWKFTNAHGEEDKFYGDAIVDCSEAGTYTAIWTAVAPTSGSEPVSGSIIVPDDVLKAWRGLNSGPKDGWRAEDGKFNTTRLLADAAGGAVVGAAAGILTNVAMKKAQLKAGYESLQCTFGDNGAARFGETFTVR